MELVANFFENNTISACHVQFQDTKIVTAHLEDSTINRI